MRPTERRAAAHWLAVFSDPTRLAIIECLAGGPRTVTELARELKVERANLPHHLRLLLDAGAVTNAGRGSYMCYSITGAVEVAGGLEFAHPSGLKVVVPVEVVAGPG